MRASGHGLRIEIVDGAVARSPRVERGREALVAQWEAILKAARRQRARNVRMLGEGAAVVLLVDFEDVVGLLGLVEPSDAGGCGVGWGGGDGALRAGGAPGGP